MSDSTNFIKPYLRGWPIILGAMIIGFLIASKYLNYVTPMYESTAKLRLADLNEGVPNSNLFKDLDVFANSQKINAEIELLKSQTIITKALENIPFEIQIFRVGKIQNTELFSSSPILIQPIAWSEELKDKTFKLIVDTNFNYSIISESQEVFEGKLGDTISIANSKLLIELNETLLKEKKDLDIADNYEFSILSLSKQLSEINQNLDIISVDKDVPIIRISYKSAHPEKAALFPNALAQAYIEDYIDSKYSAADVTSDFLNERIKEISGKLSGTENAILNYRERENITNIRQETETDLRKISQMKIQQTNLKMSLDAIKDLDEYMEKGKNNFLELAPNFEAFNDLLSTEMIKKIKQLQSEKKDLLQQYTPKDEKVLIIDNKIEDLSSYLRESIKNTRKNLQSKYDNLVYDIEESEKVFVTVPEKEKMMTILNREFEIYQQSYNFLNQKKIEAEIAKAAKIAFHRIITPASLSKTPVSPNRAIIKIVSSLLGLFGALILIFVVHALKARVNDVVTIESQSMIPIALSVPKLKTEEESKNIFTKTVSEWEVKQLVKPKNIICFTGFEKNQGAEFIAHHILKIFSNQNRKVLFIEITAENNFASEIFWEEKPLGENLTKVMINEADLNSLNLQNWQSLLNDKSQNFDQTIILNSCFGASFTAATMATSGLNVVCVDTRLTPAKKIVEVDLMKEEFQLPNVYWALNRVGYNPSFIRDCQRFVASIINKK